MHSLNYNLKSQFHDISLGGCISYVEVPDMSKNLDCSRTNNKLYLP